MRPLSIRRFEACYLAALLVGFVNSLILLPSMLHSPRAAQAIATTGPGVVYASLALGVAIPLLLWFLAARRASAAAKWIIVLFFAVALFNMLRNIVFGFPAGLVGVLGIVTFVLQAVAVAMLFRPDAKAWFASLDAVAEEVTE